MDAIARTTSAKAGVIAFDADGKEEWRIKAEDTVTVEIAGIGALTNKVINEQSKEERA